MVLDVVIMADGDMDMVGPVLADAVGVVDAAGVVALVVAGKNLQKTRKPIFYNYKKM